MGEAAKKVNYTPEQEQVLRETYTAAKSDSARKEAVDALAELMGKTKNSVISKLSRMGVYQKPAPRDKTGNPVTKKEEYISALQVLTNAPEGVLDSLEKANKTTLKFLTEFLIRMSDQHNANQ